METQLFSDILIVLGLAVAVIYAGHKARIPSIVGYLVTGILAGPHGLKLISAVEEVDMLAEIGVVLLLFTIGIEFSFKNLLKIRKTVFAGGSIQVLLCTLVVCGLGLYLNFSMGQAVYLGFVVALSSTAIVLKVLQERAEIESPHGRTALGILIFQDIVAVPMILLAPVLAGNGQMHGSVSLILLKVLLILVFFFVAIKWVVPDLLYRSARTRSRELFLLTVVVLCLSVAGLTSWAGLSPALGAFLAGLIISESEYSHQALGNILPFRDIFTSFFFISIGMLLNPGFVLEHWNVVLLLTGGVLLLKTFAATISAQILGLPLRTGLLVGFALCQVGEFSFVLAGAGLSVGLLSAELYQVVLSFSVISMALTPFIIAGAPRMADGLCRLPLPAAIKYGFSDQQEPQDETLNNHLVIVGFGVNGRNVGRAAELAGIRYTVIEMNPDTVRQERLKGEPIFFGDASRDAVLAKACIDKARVVVVAIHDAAATRRIVATAHRLGPRARLVVRTRFLTEMEPLYSLGADEVIPEEFETSVEIFTRVLNHYLIPRNDIERFITEIRSEGYEMFRRISRRASSLSALAIPDVEVVALNIEAGAALDGVSIAGAGLRKNYGVTVIAVRRGETTFANPEPDQDLVAGDIMVVMATSDKISGFLPFVRREA